MPPKGKPKTGIALVFGPPMKKGKPEYDDDEEPDEDDLPDDTYEEMARAAFPGLDPEDIDPVALKDFVMACMGK